MIPALTFSNIFLKTLTEGAVTTKAGGLFQYFTTPHRNRLTISFGGGSYLGVPCRSALGSHVECEGEKQVRPNIQETRE